MSDEFRPLTSEDRLPPELSHRRILMLMGGIVIAGAIGGFAFVSPKFGIGVLVGGVLAFANYFWQRNSTRAIFAKAANGEKPFLPALRYILRYFALGMIIWVFHAAGILPIVAVILGLAAFAFAVVIEGLIGIFTDSNREF